AWRWDRRLAFLGTWFFVTLAPASSIVPILTEVGAERRMYLPLAALVVLIVAGVTLLWDRAGRTLAERSARMTPQTGRLVFAVGLLAAGAYLSTLTIMRNREYSSPLRLAETVLERW